MSPPLIRVPFFAPLPIPATFETGAPMTNAPGQAITKNVIAKWTSRIIKYTSTDNSATPGVYHCEKRSRNFSVFDLLSCASSTSSIILEKAVSAPTFSATISIYPVSATVPAYTLSPSALETGTDSPVTAASLIEASPSTTSPSTGTRAPGKITSRSPSSTSSTGIVSRPPF